jgi:hypothetical protein
MVWVKSGCQRSLGLQGILVYLLSSSLCFCHDHRPILVCVRSVVMTSPTSRARRKEKHFTKIFDNTAVSQNI